MKYRIFALLIVFLFITVFTACNAADIKEPEDIEEIIEEPVSKRTEIVIGSSRITGDFSPLNNYYYGEGGDACVVRVINAPLVTLDRRGEIITGAGRGQTKAFNGEDYDYEGICDVQTSLHETDKDKTTSINFRLNRDVMFSDGTRLNADDLIFTLYVLCDVDYKGIYKVSSLPIRGLEYYHANTDMETYKKYAALATDILENDDDNYDEEQYELFYECYKISWLSHVNDIIEYCIKYYGDYASSIFEGFSGDINDNARFQTALAMIIWKVADFDEIIPPTEDSDGIYGEFISLSGKEWDLINDFPTPEDFYNEFYELYEGDINAYSRNEKINKESGSDDLIKEAVRLFIEKMAANDEESGRVNNIAGIRKVNDYEVEVTLNGHIPAAAYSFLFPVIPLHYYGDIDFYNYNSNRFGFRRGNLSGIRENDQTKEPLGAGAYKLIRYDGYEAVLTANEHYFKGKPETEEIVFREVNQFDLVYGAATNTLDIAAVTGSKDILDEINIYINEGAKFGVQEAFYGGMGYIGFNTERVRINLDDEDIEINTNTGSTDFRKGIATIFAAYRNITITDYFGGSASITDYPVSGMSWTAPRDFDNGYRTAYSQGITGSSIYTPGMSEAQSLEIAKRTALEFFEAAGCVLNPERTMIEAFPEGLRGSYNIYITGGTLGRHPSYLMVVMASEILRSVGIELEIIDVASQGEMFEAVINGESDMWCAAWEGSVMPNLSRNFSSGGEENFFRLHDEDTDRRIAAVEGALSVDLYRNAFEYVLESAACVPVYQRKIYYMFGEGLESEAIEENLTAYYNYTEILWKLKLGGEVND